MLLWNVTKLQISWRNNICDALRDLAPIVQFEKREKHPWRSVTFSKPATLLKVILLHGCFSRFLKCTSGTKSRKASDMNFLQMQVLLCAFTLTFDHVSVTILNTFSFTFTFSLIRNF